MDSKLINRQQLPANRWQQDDTPCFVPFPSQSIKYWITTLLIAMMSIVGAWGQTDKVLDATQIWESCLYSSDEEAKFALKYLIPKIDKNIKVLCFG